MYALRKYVYAVDKLIFLILLFQFFSVYIHSKAYLSRKLLVKMINIWTGKINYTL